MAPLAKTTRLTDTAAKRKAAEAKRQEVYRLVDRRDGHHCRACGRKVITTIAFVPERRERHHVIPRSLGGKDATRNVLTLCLECHQARHVTRALTMTGNANQPVTFERDGQQWKG